MQGDDLSMLCNLAFTVCLFCFWNLEWWVTTAEDATGYFSCQLTTGSQGNSRIFYSIYTALEHVTCVIQGWWVNLTMDPTGECWFSKTHSKSNVTSFYVLSERSPHELILYISSESWCFTAVVSLNGEVVVICHSSAQSCLRKAELQQTGRSICLRAANYSWPSCAV